MLNQPLVREADLYNQAFRDAQRPKT